MKKVKLAEEMSDIDSSDAENHKYKRRCRARKIIESDDESDDAIFSLLLPPKNPTSVLSRQNSLKNLNAKQVQKDKSNNEVIHVSKENRNPIEKDSLSSLPCGNKRRIDYSRDDDTEPTQKMSKEHVVKSTVVNVDHLKSTIAADPGM